jgi:hypothetical protein
VDGDWPIIVEAASELSTTQISEVSVGIDIEDVARDRKACSRMAPSFFR